ncbi:hypothetical protein FRC00_004170 [Tulasnella sp. 408]|nr:hypothetical protein FRC00_004170 [Tulasnella sp. 408]
MSRPAYTTSGSGGVFEESGNYGAQPPASEPTGYGGPPADNGSEGPLVQPGYGPGGLEGQNQGPTKRPWLKWLIGIAILIIIILAVVLGAVLGTRHRGSSAYTTPQEGNSGNSSTTPAPVSPHILPWAFRHRFLSYALRILRDRVPDRRCDVTGRFVEWWSKYDRRPKSLWEWLSGHLRIFWSGFANRLAYPRRIFQWSWADRHQVRWIVHDASS